ncbi:MAG: exodeoxyribonuclease VII small subunit [Oscillospiraceae bacterium]|nr:exodeoxyribonuclease VII small subunit [Oscillospiraceae bacterium]
MNKDVRFEDAVKRIEEILEILEKRNSGLDETIALYEEGMSLLNKCDSLLEKAEQKVELLKSSYEQAPATVSFSGDAVNDAQ